MIIHFTYKSFNFGESGKELLKTDLDHGHSNLNFLHPRNCWSELRVRGLEFALAICFLEPDWLD